MNDWYTKDYVESKLAQAPKRVSWFNPFVLLRIIQGVILSAWFGRYADERKIMAALDPVDDEVLRERTQRAKKLNSTDVQWVDFVSDIGDGFNATYSVAYLMAQDTLDVKNTNTSQTVKLERAQILLIGGDLVYPDASYEKYNERMRIPYEMAYPSRARDDDKSLLYAVPGNHDWYDGLAAFQLTFCKNRDVYQNGDLVSSTPRTIGRWEGYQRRSYYALELEHGWWIWGLDIQLSGLVDRPQIEYFRLMAKQLNKTSKVIFCMAKPGWIYGDNALKAFKYIANIIDEEGNDAFTSGDIIKAILAGDLHHYSRYETLNGVKLITAGGGGAFTHLTHSLPDSVEMPDLNKNIYSKNIDYHLVQNATYPSKVISKRLHRKNLLFPFKNWGFAITIGVFYFLAGWVFRTTDNGNLFNKWAKLIDDGILNIWSYLGSFIETIFKSPALAFVIGISMFGVGAYTRIPNRQWLRWSSGLGHGLLHVILFLVIAVLIRVTHLHLETDNVYMESLTSVPMMILISGLIGGFLFGLYITLMSRFSGIHADHVSSALKLNGYRNFLRIKIEKDKLTIFPIGLDVVPEREGWEYNTQWADWDPEISNQSKNLPEGSLLIPKNPMEPFLIEAPIVINTGEEK